MKTLDITLPTPEENLALDEALLMECDAGHQGEVLRFWESETPFVVLGFGNHLETETRFALCAENNIPILRRCSGGGTVLQGPGCLNFSLTLKITDKGPTKNVSTTNAHAMERNRSAVEALLGHAVKIQGYTDLVTDGLKFSGNAQRRKRRALLFHGTLMHGLNLGMLERMLPHPSSEPGYRAGRPHRQFLKNLPVPPKTLKDALQGVWKSQGNAPVPPPDLVAWLVREKYGNPFWTHRR